MSLYHTIEYTFMKDNEEYLYDYKVCESFQDYFEYKFIKKYNIEYRPTAWHLEQGAKKMYNYLENEYLQNKLDLRESYEYDYDFREFLKDKYAVTAELKFNEKYC